MTLVTVTATESPIVNGPIVSGSTFQNGRTMTVSYTEEVFGGMSVFNDPVSGRGACEVYGDIITNYGNIIGKMGNITEATANQGILVVGNLGLGTTAHPVEAPLRVGSTDTTTLVSQVPFTNVTAYLDDDFSSGYQTLLIYEEGQVSTIFLGAYYRDSPAVVTVTIYAGRGVGGTLVATKSNLSLPSSFGVVDMSNPLTLSFGPTELYLNSGEYTVQITKVSGGHLALQGNAGSYIGVTSWGVGFVNWMSMAYTSARPRGLRVTNNSCNINSETVILGNLTSYSIAVSRSDQLASAANTGNVILPSNVAGFLKVKVGGSSFLLPCYLP